MENQISPIAWVIIGVLVVVIIVVNLALIATFLGRNRPQGDQHAPRPERPPYNDLPETIRHPWHREDEMLDELSKRVKEMQKPEKK